MRKTDGPGVDRQMDLEQKDRWTWSRQTDGPGADRQMVRGMERKASLDQRQLNRERGRQIDLIQRQIDM